MIIVMKPESTEDDIKTVTSRIEKMNLRAHVDKGEQRTVIGVVGDTRSLVIENFTIWEGVERVARITKPYKLASREFISGHSTFPLDGVSVGGNGLVIIAGPCSVETHSQLMETAFAVREAGAHALRGGAFKPRTSPYAFQGLGEKGLELLAEAREATGLPIVTEVMAPEDVPLVAKFADVLQIGARNMQNFALLHAAGASQKTVLLKRGMAATIEELLMAAEYILSHGNRRVMLCERGIRTFETATRNTTDINAIPVLKEITHLPVLLDPSHSTGNWQYVGAVAKAAVAAGADGLIIEVHPNPENALSDGAQSLKPERFAELVSQLRLVANAVGRDIAVSTHASVAEN